MFPRDPPDLSDDSRRGFWTLQQQPRTCMTEVEIDTRRDRRNGRRCLPAGATEGGAPHAEGARSGASVLSERGRRSLAGGEEHAMSACGPLHSLGRPATAANARGIVVEGVSDVLAAPRTFGVV